MTVRSLSLAEIAIAAGFANQRNFTRVFSTLVGISPSLWRREALCAPKSET
jgi:transcriptional regulator GlxA family with amidase domain